jgi:hypothetical protein
MPSKLNKCGVKIFALAEGMYYTKNMEVYDGNQPEGPLNVNNVAASTAKTT